MDLAAALAAWSAGFATHGFAGATLARVARTAGVPLDALATRLAGRWEALDQLNLAIDRAALAQARPDPATSARERLFELAMARFEAMRTHRPALRRVLAEARVRPGLALALALQLGRSANTLLGAADIGTTGLGGIARIKALAAILADVGRVWETDEDPDLGATMAALDRRLGQAERCALRLCGRGDGAGEEAGRGAPAGDAGPASPGDLPEPPGDSGDLPEPPGPSDLPEPPVPADLPEPPGDSSDLPEPPADPDTPSGPASGRRRARPSAASNPSTGSPA